MSELGTCVLKREQFDPLEALGNGPQIFQSTQGNLTHLFKTVPSNHRDLFTSWRMEHSPPLLSSMEVGNHQDFILLAGQKETRR